MELISVIVPVYRVEPFLDRCVTSLVNQTYTELEIILVDDGSPDNCGTMCDAWAEKDSRIRVIHKENGGLSDARNAGLEIASGEYIAFVDSDDWVSSEFLQELFETLQNTHSDIVECEILRTTGIVSGPLTEIGKSNNYTPKEALKLLIEDRIFHQYVWNKLYRKEVMDSISFAIGKTNEDEFWTYQVFGRANRVTKLNKPLYFYFQRSDSIMGAQYSLRRLDALEAKRQRQQYIDRFFPEISQIARINWFGSCIFSGQMALRYLSRPERRIACEIINEAQRVARPSSDDIKRLSGSGKMWTQLARFNFWGTCRIKNLLKKGF